VSTTDGDLYEWGADDCEEGATARDFRPLPAALYRIPLAGGRAEAVLAAGTPKDQFSLDAREQQFLALVRWAPGDCATSDEDYPLRYVRIPTDAFGSRPTSVPLERYFVLPTPAGDDIENRFTEGYLVYGGSQGRWGAFGWRYDYQATDLVTVPVDAPASLSVLSLAHSAERVEVFGDNVIVDGYRGNGGLSVSTVDLRSRPVVSDVAYLEGVIESEGRSHAFNGLVDEDGSGLFGVPTTFKRASWRDYYDAGSNVHFFGVDRALAIHPAGYLAPDPGAVDDAYDCEVSCVDWYGNARPIFMNGRIFALTSTELIEAYLGNGQVLELQRVGMTGIPLHRR
jgi:hypothetical protein